MPTFVQLIVLTIYSNYSCLLHLFYISRTVEYFLYIPWGCRRSLKLRIKRIKIAQSFTRIVFFTLLLCIAVKRPDEIHNRTRHTHWRFSVDINNKNRNRTKRNFFFLVNKKEIKLFSRGGSRWLGGSSDFQRNLRFAWVVLLLAQK